MTNLLIKTVPMEPDVAQGLSPRSEAARASLYVFFASPKTDFAMRKQSTPTGIPQ